MKMLLNYIEHLLNLKLVILILTNQFLLPIILYIKSSLSIDDNKILLKYVSFKYYAFFVFIPSERK